MSDPFIAEIIMFGGNFAPRGWALCDGQLLSISQNSALFSILGTTYGGDGRTNFGLPDLRSRSPVHAGNGPGLPQVRLGEKSGSPNSTLPTHTHTATSTSVAHAVGPGGNSNDAIGNIWADDVGVSSGTYHTGPANAVMNAGAVTTTTANSSAGISPTNTNYHPYQAVNFIIALVGTFPSRN